MTKSILSHLGCIGFIRPVHCLFGILALVCNSFLASIRLSRFAKSSPSAFQFSLFLHETSADIPLEPSCSYAVLSALHLLTIGYFVHQLTILRRQTPVAVCVCLFHFFASFAIFLSLLATILPIGGSGVLNVFAESVCFLVLVSDFSKPIRTVEASLNGNHSRYFVGILTEIFVDLLMQLLIISLGVLFRLPAVLRACTYAAIALSSTFLSFYLVVPSIIAIYLFLAKKFDGTRVGLHVKTSPSLKEPNQPDIPYDGLKVLSSRVDEINPLARRVKFIMSAAILLVHAHSKLKPTSASLAHQIFSQSSSYEQRVENMSHQERRVGDSYKLNELNDWSEFDEVSAADWGLTLVLALVICLRFLLFSDYHDGIQQNAGVHAEQVTNENSEGTEESDTSSGDEISKLEEVKPVKNFVCDSEDSTESDLDPDSVCCTRKGSVKAPVRFHPVKQTFDPSPSFSGKNDQEIVDYFHEKDLPLYTLEGKMMKDESDKEAGATRAVAIRRGVMKKRNPEIASAIENVPYSHYGQFSTVVGACCENVIGMVPLPVGLAGPLKIDGSDIMLPMATTEGCLVASVNRGCKILTASGGVTTVLLNDGMSRAPVVRLPNISSAVELRNWLKSPENFSKISEVFNGTSRFCRLQTVEPFQAGAYVFIRYVAQTGDAMGMNMVSRACESAMTFVMDQFPACRLLSLSGNCCADKKSAAVNWLMGRGKSVISEAIIPRDFICQMLRTTPEALVKLNTAKNLIGSAVAGAGPGGFNAHAANILAALYIATGQDVAQVVESSGCLTILEVTGDTPVTSVSEEPHGGDLHITCTLPTIEVGTIGGGTILGPQRSCLEILGVAGSSFEKESSSPGDNARRLAKIAAAAVLAGELSLLAALATNQLMPAHLRLNRSQLSMSAAAFKVNRKNDDEGKS